LFKLNRTGTQPQQPHVVPLPFENNVTESEENTRIASSGNNVYVVSWDKKSGNLEVFLAKSTNVDKLLKIQSI
jgi:hypothetical protein